MFMLFKRWNYTEEEEKKIYITYYKKNKTPKKTSKETRAKNQEHIKHELRYIASSRACFIRRLCKCNKFKSDCFTDLLIWFTLIRHHRENGNSSDKNSNNKNNTITSSISNGNNINSDKTKREEKNVERNRCTFLRL